MDIHNNTEQWSTLFRHRLPATKRLTDAEDNSIETIHYEGNASLLLDGTRPRVAIVGTRDVSPYGKECVKRIIEALSDNPLKPIIVSGLSMGIDTLAHRYALDAGIPTAAVLPVSLDAIYPFQNKSLAKEIQTTDGCCLLSQFPEKTNPTPINFLKRKSVIAMMSDLVIVVESKQKSGAVMTARYAKELDIPVFAVPGRMDDFRSAGCNWLIATDMAVILSNTDVLKQENLFKTIIPPIAK